MNIGCAGDVHIFCEGQSSRGTCFLCSMAS